MKLIEKYIIKELIPIFILGNFFFIFLLLLDKLISLSDLIFTKNVPFFFIIELIIFYIPSFLVITIPTSTLLASLIVYGRLSDDSELIAIKSFGANKISLYKPTIIFGTLSLILAILMSTYLMPLGNEFAIKKLFEVSKFVSIKDFKEHELYTEIPGFILYADKKINHNKYSGLIIINKDKNVVITSKLGTITNTNDGNLIFNLKKGSLLNMSKTTPSKIEFSNFLINIPIIAKNKIDIKSERLMTLKELKSNFKKNTLYKFEYSKRFALPFASIIMAFFGAILGSFFHRSGKTFGLFMSILVVLVYNSLFIFSQNMINTMPPFLAAWIANIIFCLLSILALKKV
ncbi:YjgP/YjgQ family permease [Deferribacter autotrophicus]|uniref:YjgP/YjgQ family permease n=1 Tax=Deferribacter autotrophicus TaxID=500465 RepID=A0A5A8F7T3_9BACT|nr:LptF/LptG family permease [Deferribacter autotrophicus]KAA0258018.1 YjgP/YjgQ family permease [Deferribacter autotrophicus]